MGHQETPHEGDGKAQVNILLVPETAVAKIGDKEYSSNNYQIEVGEYDVEISAPGYASKNVKLKVTEDGDDIVLLYNYLEPTSSYSERDQERYDLIRDFIRGGS